MGTRCIAALTLCALFLACGSPVPAEVAEGTFQSHTSGSWGFVLPDDWQAHGSSNGVSLVRRTPYEGGYPTLNIRLLGSDEEAYYPIEGRSTSVPSGEVTYRFQRWRNSLGRGHRLEALLRTPDGAVFFVDASVWDTAARPDGDFFATQFWPVINSVRTTRVP